MAITSLTFLLFAFLTLLVYYLVPKRVQWVILLAASIVFYLSCGVKSIIYVLITATTVYFATRWMNSIAKKQRAFIKEHRESLSKDEKASYKKKKQKGRRAIMVVTLLLNIGILCVFKYCHFALEQFNGIAAWFGGRGIEDTISLIVPLGISFYTFQSVGYLLDVYWEYITPETNYLKVLLFVSFFPQMTQGPISNFESLSTELFKEHPLDYKNFSWGFQRMLWGFMKKMIIADTFAPYVKDVFANYAQYSGISVLIGAFMYSVQIYADFSGYMDIMCGYCEMLGIRLSENFERPYFAKSIAEYWRRWHITLGEWFKKYIYYPIGMSNWSRNLAKKSKDKLGKHFADTMPATIALVVTWLATGLWHGASGAYVAWGLVNGLFIIFSLWMEPVYAGCKSRLRINENAWLWRAFQTVRTFILVTFIKVLPEVGTLSDGFGLWKRIFTNHTVPHSLSAMLPFVNLSDKLVIIDFLVAIVFLVVFAVSSLLQRRKPIRAYFNKLPWFVRVLLAVVLAVLIAMYGVKASWGGDGFLYANF